MEFIIAIIILFFLFRWAVKLFLRAYFRRITHPSQRKDSSASRSDMASGKHKKVIESNEGEYIDYEEFKN
ncbi:MAG: DUF4834 family protein [Candidatus Symbiothrix sp.]|jgi:hypothetical protein|nr:DUF4834 family protein [Candidatus Symbiothrix sp.]